MLRTAFRVTRRTFSAQAAPAGSGTELKLTFGTPHQPIYTNHTVTGLSLPSDEGYFSILPNKPSAIGQLKAGLVTIHHVGGNEEKFFVSGGFAFNRADNTTDVSVPEAFALSDIDPDALKKEWTEAQKNYGAAVTPEDKAEAFVQLTTLQELSRVLGVAV